MSARTTKRPSAWSGKPSCFWRQEAGGLHGRVASLEITTPQRSANPARPRATPPSPSFRLFHVCPRPAPYNAVCCFHQRRNHRSSLANIFANSPILDADAPAARQPTHALSHLPHLPVGTGPSIAPSRRTIDVRRLSHLGMKSRLCNLCDSHLNCDWEIYWHPLVLQPTQDLVAGLVL